MKLITRTLAMQGWWSIGPKGLFLKLPDDVSSAFFGPEITSAKEGQLWSLADAIKHYLGFGQLKGGYLQITIEELDEPSPIVVKITTEIYAEE